MVDGVREFQGPVLGIRIASGPKLHVAAGGGGVVRLIRDLDVHIAVSPGNGRFRQESKGIV